MNNNQKEIIRQIIWLRQAQLIVNEFYKRGDFMLPIHLAMGHESIAVAVDNSLKKQDSLFLTHRNIHYNLARLKKLKPELDEYFLKELYSNYKNSIFIFKPRNYIYITILVSLLLLIIIFYKIAKKISYICIAILTILIILIIIDNIK